MSFLNQNDCPICGSNITFEEEVVVSELVSCADCGSELEVVGVNPLELSEAPQEEEDWGQ